MKVPTSIENLGYNPALEQFEAIVTMHRGGDTYRYACAIAAPITADFDDLAPVFRDQALRAHIGPAASLRLRGVTMPPRQPAPEMALKLAAAA